MVLLVSEQMQTRREQKFRRELARALSIGTAESLRQFLRQIFSAYANQPPPDDFVQITMASKFGTGNAIAGGGSGFLFEASLRAFSQAIKTKALAKAKEQPWESHHLVMFDKSDCWNAAFFLEADAKLLPHANAIRAEQFVLAESISPFLFLDFETQAFGFLVLPMAGMSLGELKAYGRDELDGWEDGVEDRFANQGYCQYQLPGFSTGAMRSISPVHVKFGPVDKLVQLIPGREKHQVSSHSRTLQSGKVTTVQAHRRKNPLRLVANNRALTDHIVYEVRDADGVIRYYGEGKSDRWKHVNSGVSHNWKSTSTTSLVAKCLSALSLKV